MDSVYILDVSFSPQATIKPLFSLVRLKPLRRSDDPLEYPPLPVLRTLRVSLPPPKLSGEESYVEILEHILSQRVALGCPVKELLLCGRVDGLTDHDILFFRTIVPKVTVLE